MFDDTTDGDSSALADQLTYDWAAALSKACDLGVSMEAGRSIISSAGAATLSATSEESTACSVHLNKRPCDTVTRSDGQRNSFYSTTRSPTLVSQTCGVCLLSLVACDDNNVSSLLYTSHGTLTLPCCGTLVHGKCLQRCAQLRAVRKHCTACQRPFDEVLYAALDRWESEAKEAAALRVRSFNDALRDTSCWQQVDCIARTSKRKRRPNVRYVTL